MFTKKSEQTNSTRFLIKTLFYFSIFILSTSGFGAPLTDCPLKTKEEWQVFIKKVAENPLWVETCEDELCDPENYRWVMAEVVIPLQNCASFLNTHPGIEKCVRRLEDLAPHWLKQHDSSTYGFEINNERYLQDEENPSRPEKMMQVPPSLVAALPDKSKVEEVARLNGWPYLTHDSGLGGDRTFVIISDPEDRYDTWLLLNLQHGKKAINDNQPMSMLAVQKKDRNGKRLPKVQLHFRDYTLIREEKAYFLELFPENNGKCYSCHTNGVRQLIERKTAILDAKPVKGEKGFQLNAENIPKDFAYKRLLEFNRRLRSYGRPDWEGKLHPEVFGPALGKKEGCTNCHNNETRASLNIATSHNQVKQKILHELTMPMNKNNVKLLEKELQGTLSEEEKRNLKQIRLKQAKVFLEFEASRLPLLKNWLTEIPCS